MANYCNYEVKVIGSEKACLMVFESMPYMDYNQIETKNQKNELTELMFAGNCKWSVNFKVRDVLSKVDVDSFDETLIQEKASDYYQYSLRAKSEAFECEILVHYWSEESGFDQFDHYKNGEIIKKRKIKFNSKKQNRFDWNKTEFVGHEGEYDESVDGEEQDEKYVKFITDTINKLAGKTDVSIDTKRDKNMSKDMGKVENAMYQWTFTQGNTVNLNEWTIGIPDGFMKINSEEMIPTTHKKRPFELVPIKDKENPECAMVRILPGLLSKGVGADSYEMYHPIAKEGMAALFASSSADTQQKFADSPPRVFYTVWNHLFACILEQETLFGTINCQCLVMSNGTTQIIEVETGVDDADDFDENKKRKLEQSIILWLHTMKPNKTKVDIPTVMFEDGDCLVEVMKGGNLKKFEAAVEQAHREYRISIIGKLHVLKYELGDRKQFLREIVNKILLDGMKVREFYAEKANDFVKRVQKSKVNVDTFIKVLRKLLELMQDDEFAKVTVGNSIVKVDVPDRVKEIEKEWEKILRFEEEKKTRELQKKREIEEAKRKTALEKEAAEKKARMEKEVAAWTEEVEIIKKDREANRIEKIASYEDVAKIRKQHAEEVRTTQLDSTNSMIQVLKNRLSLDTTELGQLGVFKFRRRKELQNSIEQLTRELQEKEHVLITIDKEYEKEIKNADKEYTRKVNDLSAYLDKKYQVPESPMVVEERKQREEEKEKKERKIKEDPNYEIKLEIIELLESGESMMCTEVAKELDISINKAVALMSQLAGSADMEKREPGKIYPLIRFADGKRIKFKINPEWDSEL